MAKPTSFNFSMSLKANFRVCIKLRFKTKGEVKHCFPNGRGLDSPLRDEKTSTSTQSSANKRNDASSAAVVAASSDPPLSHRSAGVVSQTGRARREAGPTRE